MKENELFRLALGLASPWEVKALEFSLEQKRLDLILDFAKGSRFPCPICGNACGVYDTEERCWRHLNFFQHETYLHARQPRIQCPEHQVKTVEVPWARSGVGFTLLFEALVMILAQNGMTPNAIGRLVGEYDTLIWRILHHYVDEARQEQDLSAVTQVGVDETSRAKGHKYVTTFMDLDTRRIVFAVEGKDAETVKAFKADLADHGGETEQVKEFCADMSPAFRSGIEAEFPQAQITFDPFHLMKMMNAAVDAVRREEQKTHPELRGSKFVWLTNEWNHNPRQKDLFQALRKRNLKTNQAHHLKGVFQDIYACSPQEGEALLKRWYYWATHSRMQPIIDFARTVKRHWDGVVWWFQTKISNGLLEGMNSLIQAAKARSRGFRNVKNFITMIYLIGAKLEFHLPEVLPSTHTK
jgi:transposase